MSGAKKIIKLLKKLSLLIDIRSGIKYSKNSLSLWNYRYYIQTILKFFYRNIYWIVEYSSECKSKYFK